MDDVYTLQNIKVSDQAQTVTIEIEVGKLEEGCSLSDLSDILRMVADECEKNKRSKDKKS
jgi:hypothetical protein